MYVISNIVISLLVFHRNASLVPSLPNHSILQIRMYINTVVVQHIMHVIVATQGMRPLPDMYA